MRGGYRIRDYHLPCGSCLCMRCSCLKCKYEKFYQSYPQNAGCIHCLQMDRKDAVRECGEFTIRTATPLYRIRFRRKNPYYALSKTLAVLHRQLTKVGGGGKL